MRAIGKVKPHSLLLKTMVNTICNPTAKTIGTSSRRLEKRQSHPEVLVR